MVQDVDGLEEVSSHPNLAGEVGRVGQDLLGLGLELHTGSVIVLHRSLDTDNL